MLQQQKAEDFVIATGVQVSVREFVQRAAAELGITVTFAGDGEKEIGTVTAVSGERARCKAGDVVVRVDSRYFRPTEVDSLLGDASKAKAKLGWTPKISFHELVKEMVREDLKAAERDELVKSRGH